MKFTRGKNALVLWAAFWSTVYVASLLWSAYR